MNEIYELLPESMLNCVVNGRELSVVRISGSELTIRMTKEHSDSIIKYSGDNTSPLFVIINIYDYYAGRYDSIIVKKTSYKSICHRKYYDEVTLEYLDEDNIIDTKLTAAVNHYWRYIMLKSEDYDNTFSKYMCNYPEDKDYEYPEDFVSQREKICTGYDFNKVFNNSESEIDKKKYAIKISNYLLYDSFLTMNIKDYIVKYFKDAGVSLTKDNYNKINGVYIGNSFCPNLFPDDDMLIKMINKAHDNNLDITVECSYMRQDDIDRYIKLFDKLITWCNENSVYIRIVVNDYGMLYMLNDDRYREYFIISLGVLINKYRKDPRMKYKNRLTDKDMYNVKNAMSNEDYLNLMREYKVSECEYESNPIRYDMPLKMALTIPFYQTNTSGNCPLYAKLVNGERGRQKAVINCGRLCEKKVFLYPLHLNMVGRYNSIFAFNENVIDDVEYYRYYNFYKDYDSDKNCITKDCIAKNCITNDYITNDYTTKDYITKECPGINMSEDKREADSNRISRIVFDFL